MTKEKLRSLRIMRKIVCIMKTQFKLPYISARNLWLDNNNQKESKTNYYKDHNYRMEI